MTWYKKAYRFAPPTFLEWETELCQSQLSSTQLGVSTRSIYTGPDKSLVVTWWLANMSDGGLIMNQILNFIYFLIFRLMLFYSSFSYNIIYFPVQHLQLIYLFNSFWCSNWLLQKNLGATWAGIKENEPTFGRFHLKFKLLVSIQVCDI